jgi:tRNA A-37 threonylcarbamoyl transferase component Bud32
MIRAGQKIGHIRIEECLGAGGMGAVFVGFDEKLQRRVALKAIRSDRLDAVTRRRFLAEARVLSQLDHPNICRIHGYLEGEEEDFLVLELIPGRTLRQALAAGIEPRDRLRIAEEVARALAAAHERGVVHRDLKPDNVMLTEALEAKVLDFGLARSAEDDGTESVPSVAEPSMYRQALAIQKRALGPDHPSVAYTLMNLGLLLRERSDLAGAEPLYRRAIAIWEKRLGSDHPLVVQALGNLADLRRERGDPAAAQALYQRAIDATRQRLAGDPGNPGQRQHLAQTLVEIGKLERDSGQEARAKKSWSEAVTLMAPLTGNAKAVDFLDTHARALLYLGRVDEARPLVKTLLARGWNDAEFLELCRKQGLCPR